MIFYSPWKGGGRGRPALHAGLSLLRGVDRGAVSVSERRAGTPRPGAELPGLAGDPGERLGPIGGLVPDREGTPVPQRGPSGAENWSVTEEIGASRARAAP